MLAEHEQLIRSIVGHYIEACVEIVPDIAEWCAEHSGRNYVASEMDNPIGKALWNSPVEPNRILLRNHITEQQIENHLLALHMKGFVDVYERIQDEKSFMKYLVLHEVAHIKHDWRQNHETACDRWAFDELNEWMET